MKRTSLGFPHRVPVWMGAARAMGALRRMGQAITPPERTQMIAALAEAQNKMAAVQAWADAQRDLSARLGGDAARFRALRERVDSAATNAVAAFMILQQPDPVSWNISGQRADADAYVAGATELSDIVRRAAPSQWDRLLNAIVTGATALIPGILAEGGAEPPPPPGTTRPPPGKPSEDWPWWAYALAGLAGLVLVGGVVMLLAPKAPPAVISGGRRDAFGGVRHGLAPRRFGGA